MKLCKSHSTADADSGSPESQFMSHSVGHSGNPNVQTFGIVRIFNPSNVSGFFQRLSFHVS